MNYYQKWQLVDIFTALWATGHAAILYFTRDVEWITGIAIFVFLICAFLLVMDAVRLHREDMLERGEDEELE